MKGEGCSDDWLDGISLVVRRSMLVRQLPGFSKQKHRVPDTHDRRAQEFVASVGTPLIHDDLDATFTGLRTVMGFKRRELQVTESDEGFGAIQTPYFLYANSVSQSDNDPAQAVWQRELSQFTSADAVGDELCNRLFETVFDTIEFLPASPISLEKLVDHVEDLEDSRVQANYDRGLSFCRLAIDGFPFTILVQRDVFRLVHFEPAPPRQLLQCIQDFRQRIVDFRILTVR